MVGASGYLINRILMLDFVMLAAIRSQPEKRYKMRIRNRLPTDGANNGAGGKNVGRRGFLGYAIGGIAIATPALHMLADASPASAVRVASSDPCANYYVKYLGHDCSGASGCPSGSDGDCIGNYDKYSSTTGQYCGSFQDIECEECCHYS